MFSPFGVSLSEAARNDSIAVGTTSVIVSDVRQSTLPRRDILLRNISPNATDIISITLGQQQAVANTGIVLRQNESMTFSTSEGNPCPQAQFSAICATATGVLAVFER
jgi:hypothetical protein